MTKVIDLKKAKSNRRKAAGNRTTARNGASSRSGASAYVNGSGKPRQSPGQAGYQENQVSIFRGPARDRLAALIQIIVFFVIATWLMKSCSM